jgi:hypothetical protein
MKYESRIIQIGDKKLRADVADTMSKRAKGLSGRKKLLDGECMLFIFPYPAGQQLWMRGMNFPIDVLWIGESKKIVHIEENLQPTRHILDFTTYGSPKSAIYVIELSAGFVKKNKVKTSTKIKI